MDVMGAALTSIDQAPLSLSPFVLDNAFGVCRLLFPSPFALVLTRLLLLGNTHTLLSPIVQHYTRQIIQKLYLLLGSFSFLGSLLFLLRPLPVNLC